jgi:FkbM family methyltransferase
MRLKIKDSIKKIIKKIIIGPSLRKKIKENISVTIHKSIYFDIYHRNIYSDISAIFSIFIKNEYSFEKFPHSKEIINRYQDLLSKQKTPLIIDLGSNIGVSVKYFHAKFPEAKIVAVEPDKYNYEILKLNAKNIAECTVFNMGVSSSRKLMRLMDYGNGELGFRTEDVTECETAEKNRVGIVETQTLEFFANTYPSSVPFLVKMDIEGAEKDVFSNGGEQFDAFDVVVVEIHDWMLPWENISNGLLSWATTNKRDVVINGENLFFFKKPGELNDL